MTEHSNTAVVPDGGTYKCTSCGNTAEFEVGDDFTICDACGDDTAGWEPQAAEVVEEGLSEEEY